MGRQKTFAFADLDSADLIVDAVYEGGGYGNVRDDPIAPLVGGGNQGGFRYLGKISPFSIRHCVLYSDLADLDWPDRLDPETGHFTYYGDNKTPGGGLHETTRGGNQILREVFSLEHVGRRNLIPPVLVFTKGAKGRDVVFRGLAVPGATEISQAEDLVAIWKTKGNQRFQNYKAIFTILDAPVLQRRWIEDLKQGNDAGRYAPSAWMTWRDSGNRIALAAPRSKEHRSPSEQLPTSRSDLGLLAHIVEHYNEHPHGTYAFERCAAEIVRLLDSNVRSIDLTRPWRDGGRDGLGLYQIGDSPSSLQVEFSLEAKCKKPSPKNSSGVRETARLVARLRHRQFGVFVTTSCIGEQAYRELIEDAHPVLVVAGADIVRVLKEHGLGSLDSLKQWLRTVDQN